MSQIRADPVPRGLLLNFAEVCLAVMVIFGVGARTPSAVGTAACVAAFGGYCASLLMAARPGRANGYTALGTLVGVRLVRQSGAPLTRATVFIKRAPSLFTLATLAWYNGVAALQDHRNALYLVGAEDDIRGAPTALFLLAACISCVALIVILHTTRNGRQPAWLHGAGELTFVRQRLTETPEL